MTLKDKSGLEIELDFDGEGFPIIHISTGGSYQGEGNRPTVEVNLNGVIIHDMLCEDHFDPRWTRSN